MSLTNEQIKSILDGAPDGATHYDLYDVYYRYGNKDGWYVFMTAYAGNDWRLMPNYSIECPAHLHSLSDLAEILALRKRVVNLERIKLEWEQVVQPAYDYVDKSGIGELGKSKLGCLVESHEKLQGRCSELELELERVEQGNDLVIREVWRIVEPDTKEQGE